MKQLFLMASITIGVASVWAAGGGPLACIYHREPPHRIYMLQEHAICYQERGGVLSEQKIRSFGHNYVCADNPSQVIEKLSDQEVTVIALADGSTFLLPLPLLSVLGCRVDPELPTDARSVRRFLLFWLPLHSALMSASTHEERECVVRKGVASAGMTAAAVRSLRRTGWQCKIDERYDRILAEYDTESGTESETSSRASLVSFESGSSRISFVSVPDSAGGRTKRRDSATLLCEQGREWVAGCYSEGRVSLHSQGLHSIHDLALLAQVIGDQPVEVLDLSNNAICEVPSRAFSCFPHLKTIILYNNPLRSIALDAFEGVPHLTILDMSKAELTALPDQVFNLIPELEQLILGHNELAVLPSLAVCSRLRLLALQHNHITDLPDMTAHRALEVLDVSDNLLSTGAEHMLPAVGSSLQSLLLRNNVIARLTPGFLRRIPVHGATDLRGNPIWDDTTQVALMTEGEGYQQISADAISVGRALAGQIRDVVYTDTREKLLDYLISHHLLHESVIGDEVRRARPLSAISTRPTDVGLMIYQNGHWIPLVGIVIGGVAGAGLMLFLKFGAQSIASYLGAGALVGSVAGGVIGHFVSDCYYDGDQHFYLNSGSGDGVHMSSEMRDLYVGTYRLTVLLAVLKQYLIACNTCLYWLLHYDELLDAGESVEVVMKRLDSLLHVRGDAPLARPSDAGCVVLLSELLSSSAIAEVRRHAPDDIFPAQSMVDQPLAHCATYPFLGVEKLTLVRTALCRFAQVARTLRAGLMQRYIGTRDHHHLLAVIGEVEVLRSALLSLKSDVLLPTCQAMERANQLSTAWYAEIYHLFGVTDDTLNLFTDLEEQGAALCQLRG